ncbi:MAG: hypothetical protein ABR592_12250 [Nitriliruptorales bacterium]
MTTVDIEQPGPWYRDPAVTRPASNASTAADETSQVIFWLRGGDNQTAENMGDRDLYERILRRIADDDPGIPADVAIRKYEEGPKSAVRA